MISGNKSAPQLLDDIPQMNSGTRMTDLTEGSGEAAAT
jgi:hypothetical protein